MSSGKRPEDSQHCLMPLSSDADTGSCDYYFYYIPMGGIVLAFKEYKPGLGIFGSEWVGIKHSNI